MFKVHVGFTPKGRDRWERFYSLAAAKLLVETVRKETGVVLTIVEEAPKRRRWGEVMNTNDVRALIAAGAATVSPRARLWPNGLGFDWWGVSYTFHEGEGRWVARTEGNWGAGESPTAARRAAWKGRVM